MKLPVFLAATLTGAAWTCGAEPNAAATAVNTFGITLHQRLAKPDANLCLSPYSIQLALAMTYAGAEGATKDEMARVLHYGKGDAVHASFSALQKALAQVSINTQRQAEQAREFGGAKEPFVLRTANQLFGEQSYAFKAPFLKSVRDFYAAPLEKVDFRKKSDAQTRHINQWVENKTEKRIKDLIPPGVLDEQTRLVLVNAVYMKAPWLEQFSKRATKPASFHVKGGKPEQVPTMLQQADFGYAKRDGYTALTLPYIGGEVHFLILLPDDVAGLPALERRITAKDLAACAQLQPRDVILHLPKFKLEPPSVRLGEELQAMGMKTAFDQPRGSANFEGMAERKPDDYLHISEVIHKTFLALDEEGTEAAAATAVVMATASAAVVEPPKPIEVKVDRPFLFAIQHAPTGACLFLGRVTDPR